MGLVVGTGKSGEISGGVLLLPPPNGVEKLAGGSIEPSERDGLLGVSGGTETFGNI